MGRTSAGALAEFPRKPLLRPDEVASLLGLNKRTVYRMVADGRLPKASIPARAIRIPAEPVKRMMEDEDAFIDELDF